MSVSSQTKQSKSGTWRGKSSRGRGSQHRLLDQAREKSGRLYACHGCAGQHRREECPFKDSECYKCKKIGHIARVCRAENSQGIGQLVDTEMPVEEIDKIQYFKKVNEISSGNSVDRKTISVLIDGQSVKMEIYTGAPTGLISDEVLRKIKPNCVLRKPDRHIVSFTHHVLECLGFIPVQATVGSTSKQLNLYVVKGKYDSLVGRDWLAQFVHETPYTGPRPAAETVVTRFR